MQASTNYIYILFAVAYAIYSVIKAGKKVAANRSTPSPNSNPVSEKEQSKDDFKPVQPPTATPIPQYNPGEDLRKMLGDLMGRTQETKVPEIQAPKPKQKIYFEKSKHRQPESSQHPSENTKIISHSFENEKLRSAPNEQAANKSRAASMKVIAEPVIGEGLEADFDIRQAVIYSEILKRPDW